MQMQDTNDPNTTTDEQNTVSGSVSPKGEIPDQSIAPSSSPETASPETASPDNPGRTPGSYIDPIPVDFHKPASEQLKDYVEKYDSLAGLIKVDWNTPADEQILQNSNNFISNLPGYWNYIEFSKESATVQIKENFDRDFRRFNDGAFVPTNPDISVDRQMDINHNLQPAALDLDMCEARKKQGIIESASTDTGKACAKLLQAPTGQ
ncbi:hypothetical protein MMC07_001513 [Pseudocyphellaria aurata]|nr:hypothetical protein [Pseudocyphellaria aurata]